jgi:hypothetical protein
VHAQNQEAEVAAGLQRTVADKKTISRIADRAIAAGHVVRALMRLKGRSARDKVRQFEVLVCTGVPLDRALLDEVGSPARMAAACPTACALPCMHAGPSDELMSLLYSCHACQKLMLKRGGSWACNVGPKSLAAAIAMDSLQWQLFLP